MRKSQHKTYLIRARIDATFPRYTDKPRIIVGIVLYSVSYPFKTVKLSASGGSNCGNIRPFGLRNLLRRHSGICADPGGYLLIGIKKITALTDGLPVRQNLSYIG